MDIQALASKFKGEEVSEMIPPFPSAMNPPFKDVSRDETAFRQSLWRIFCLTMGSVLRNEQ